MAEINLPDSERKALEAIEESVLRDLIQTAFRDAHLGDLHRLPLASSGPYVSSKLHHFTEALSNYRQAKSAKNRENKRYDLMRAGDDLLFAVMQMKHRVEVEAKDRELFRIDDYVRQPWRFGRILDVRIYYQWRKSTEDEWQSGNIAFSHEVRPRYVLNDSPAKRKPSVAKQAQQLQDELASIWEHLTQSALFSLRDFFREGGDGKEIPESFRAIPDLSGNLTNFSTVFWKKTSNRVR